MSREVDTLLESTVRWNAHKYAVGQTMFCQACGTVLDCRKSVELSIHKGQSILALVVVCSRCWDRRKDRVPASALMLANKYDAPVKVEIFDGKVRRFFAYEVEPRQDSEALAEQLSLGLYPEDES